MRPRGGALSRKRRARGSEQQGVLNGNQATSYLESAEHVTQQNVSDQLSMDKMMVSDVVKTLEKRNFLTRKPHSDPERQWHGRPARDSRARCACHMITHPKE